MGGTANFLLLAVWACPVGHWKELNYIGHAFEAVKWHNRWFNHELQTVICGDFNSNAIFDHGRMKRNHTAVVTMLEDKNVLSAYHTFFSEELGAETEPTYYSWHRKSRPFHIDYVFLPREWIPTAKLLWARMGNGEGPVTMSRSSWTFLPTPQSVYFSLNDEMLSL